MPKKPAPLPDKIRKQKQQIAKTRLALNRLDALQTLTVRKARTRKLILAGAVVLLHAEKNQAFNSFLSDLLGRHLKEKRDREVFGLERKPE